MEKVITFELMFQECVIFNNGDVNNNGVVGNYGTKPLSFTTSSALTTISSIFSGCYKFNQTVSISNMEKVTTMLSAFRNCSIFNNGDITNAGTKPLSFTTSPTLTSIRYLFNNSPKFNQTLSISDISGVTMMTAAFQYASIFNNGYSTSDDTHKLFPTKPTNITSTNLFLFGELSPLAKTPSNRPHWMSTWGVI
jgi:hypothetical protein